MVNLYDYQKEAIQACKEKNTIVILPTGTGKTFIAMEVAKFKLAQAERKKVIFIARTNPLTEQHFKFIVEETGYQPLCQNLALNMLCQNVESSGPYVACLNGSNIDRCAGYEMQFFNEGHECEGSRVFSRYDIFKFLWQTADIVVATAELVLRMMEQAFISVPRSVGLIVFDEAHHSVGFDSYVNIAMCLKAMRTKITEHEFPRIIGLSASPIKEKLTDSTTIREKISRLAHLLDCAVWTKQITVPRVMEEIIFIEKSQRARRLAELLPIKRARLEEERENQLVKPAEGLEELAESIGSEASAENLGDEVECGNREFASRFPHLSSLRDFMEEVKTTWTTHAPNLNELLSTLGAGVFVQSLTDLMFFWRRQCTIANEALPFLQSFLSNTLETMGHVDTELFLTSEANVNQACLLYREAMKAEEVRVLTDQTLFNEDIELFIEQCTIGSSTLTTLTKHLREFFETSSASAKCVIFVGQRMMTRSISQYLDDHRFEICPDCKPNERFVAPVFRAVGHTARRGLSHKLIGLYRRRRLRKNAWRPSNREQFTKHSQVFKFLTPRMSMKQQQNILDSFRDDNSNLRCLVTTSLLEEGIDISNVSLVLRLTPPQNHLQNIQSRGRCRKVNGRYTHFVRPNDTRHEFMLQEFRRHENDINMGMSDAILDLAPPEPEDCESAIVNPESHSVLTRSRAAFFLESQVYGLSHVSPEGKQNFWFTNQNQSIYSDEYLSLEVEEGLFVGTWKVPQIGACDQQVPEGTVVRGQPSLKKKEAKHSVFFAGVLKLVELKVLDANFNVSGRSAYDVDIGILRSNSMPVVAPRVPTPSPEALLEDGGELTVRGRSRIFSENTVPTQWFLHKVECRNVGSEEDEEETEISMGILLRERIAVPQITTCVVSWDDPQAVKQLFLSPLDVIVSPEEHKLVSQNYSEVVTTFCGYHKSPQADSKRILFKAINGTYETYTEGSQRHGCWKTEDRECLRYASPCPLKDGQIDWDEVNRFKEVSKNLVASSSLPILKDHPDKLTADSMLLSRNHSGEENHLSAGRFYLYDCISNRPNNLRGFLRHRYSSSIKNRFSTKLEYESAQIFPMNVKTFVDFLQFTMSLYKLDFLFRLLELTELLKIVPEADYLDYLPYMACAFTAPCHPPIMPSAVDFISDSNRVFADYDVMEVFGDAILKSLSVILLYATLDMQRIHENTYLQDCVKLLSCFQSNACLMHISKTLGLPEYLLLEPVFFTKGVVCGKKRMADIVESFLGSLFWYRYDFSSETQDTVLDVDAPMAYTFESVRTIFFEHCMSGMAERVPSFQTFMAEHPELSLTEVVTFGRERVKPSLEAPTGLQPLDVQKIFPLLTVEECLEITFCLGSQAFAQILELIGDSLLCTLVTTNQVLNCAWLDDMDPYELSLGRSALVCNEYLCLKMLRRLAVHQEDESFRECITPFLKLIRGSDSQIDIVFDFLPQVADLPLAQDIGIKEVAGLRTELLPLVVQRTYKVLGDLYEMLIAAIFISCGGSFQRTWEIIGSDFQFQTGAPPKGVIRSWRVQKMQIQANRIKERLRPQKSDVPTEPETPVL